MNEKDNEKNRQHSAEGEPEDTSRTKQTFNGFEENDGYEELDRDTDYNPVYPEDDLEDEEFSDTLYEQDGNDDEPDAGDNELADTDTAISTHTDDLWEASTTDADDIDDWVDEEENELVAVPPGADSALELDDTEWQENESYAEEDTEDGQGWPMAMIAVAILALILLGVGGYGVVKQRAATQEEIRQLQATLATAVEPGKAAENREALRAAQQEADELKAQIERLTLEKTHLSDTLTGLESELDAQREALALMPTEKAPPAIAQAKKPAATTADSSAPSPVTAPATAPAKPVSKAPAPAVVSAGAGWFVNFASYGKRATADNWAAKLQPAAGNAVVTTFDSNGRTLYRVRIIDLPDKATAERVAGQLATKHGLDRLWVGQR